MNFNKKAISEITSFILLTLLIVTSSTVAYLFSNNFLEEKVAEIDRDNVDKLLKKFNVIFSNLKTFNSQTRSVSINFNSGELKFEGDKVIYDSQMKYFGSENCFNDVCYLSSSGYEIIYISLGDGYEFKKNISLEPGSYLVTFKNLKNESNINIEIK